MDGKLLEHANGKKRCAIRKSRNRKHVHILHSIWQGPRIMSVLRALGKLIANNPTKTTMTALGSGATAVGLSRDADAFQQGLTQGLIGGWADEVDDASSSVRMGRRENSVRAAEKRDKLAFTLGEAVGTLGPAALMGALGSVMLKTPRERLIGGAAIGGGHGVIAGSGAGTRSDVTAQDRVAAAAGGGVLGAGIGSVAVQGVRGLDEYVLKNIPAAIGAVKEFGEDADTWRLGAGFGRGTRPDAPLQARFASNADGALEAALAQDEGEFLSRTSAHTLGRLGEAVELRNLSAGKAGSTYNLINYALRSPGGARAWEDAVTKSRLDDLTALARSLNAPYDTARERLGGGAGRPPQRPRVPSSSLVKDMLDFALYEPSHKSWLDIVGRDARKAKGAPSLNGNQKLLLADRLVQMARQKPMLLNDPQFAEKLSAMGVKVPDLTESAAKYDAQMRRMRTAAPTEANQRLLRESARATVNRYDRAVMESGAQLSDEDAAAIISEALRKRRVFAIKPDREARALRAEYRRGMRAPRLSEVASRVSPFQVDLALALSQPAAAITVGALMSERDKQ